MRGARILFSVAVALAAAGCARQQQTYYVVDPATGQQVPVVTQQQYAQQSYRQPMAQASPGSSRGLFSSSPGYAQQTYAPQAYPQQTYTQQSYAQSYAAPAYQQPVAQPQPAGRGLFNFGQSAQPVYVQPQQPVQQSYVLQYTPPQPAAPQYSANTAYAAAAPYGYAYAPATGGQPYTLDSGDKLRIVVFGQDGISNAYLVDAGGNVNLPLIGTVPARGYTTQQLSQMISERLKQGFVREPHVTVEVETYRPFFILGEVTNPGQYPYVADMTAEKAIAIAGGFSPRADKKKVELTRSAPGQQFNGTVPLTYPLRPGDTVVVKERWF